MENKENEPWFGVRLEKDSVSRVGGLVSVPGVPGIGKKRVAGGKQEPRLGSRCLGLCREGTISASSVVPKVSFSPSLLQRECVGKHRDGGPYHHPVSSWWVGSKGGAWALLPPHHLGWGLLLLLPHPLLLENLWEVQLAVKEERKARHCCTITLHCFNPVTARKIMAMNGPWKHVIHCSWRLPHQRDWAYFFCVLLQ